MLLWCDERAFWELFQNVSMFFSRKGLKKLASSSATISHSWKFRDLLPQKGIAQATWTLHLAALSWLCCFFKNRRGTYSKPTKRFWNHYEILLNHMKLLKPRKRLKLVMIKLECYMYAAFYHESRARRMLRIMLLQCHRLMLPLNRGSKKRGFDPFGSFSPVLLLRT